MSTASVPVEAVAASTTAAALVPGARRARCGASER